MTYQEALENLDRYEQFLENQDLYTTYTERDSSPEEVLPFDIQRTKSITSRRPQEVIEKEKLDLPDFNRYFSQSPEEDFYSYAYSQYKRLNLSDDNARLLASMDVLESGNGTKPAGQYNYGNITAGKNYSGRTTTKIDNHNGKQYSFREYDTPEQYFADKLKVVSNLGFSNDKSAEENINEIQGVNRGGRRRYAEGTDGTGQRYIASVMNIYRQHV